MTLEIVESANNHHRLTITPSRVTLKILPTADEAERDFLITFANFVAKTMGEVKQSWRGKITHATYNCLPALRVTVETDKSKQRRNFISTREAMEVVSQ